MTQCVMLNLFQHLNEIDELRDPEPSSGRQITFFQQPVRFQISNCRLKKFELLIVSILNLKSAI